MCRYQFHWVGGRDKHVHNIYSRRERDRRVNARERRRRESEEKKDRSKKNDQEKWRKETQKILVMDDHRKQAERFLQLIGEQAKTDIFDSLQDKVTMVSV